MLIFGGGSTTSDEEHGPPSTAPRASRAARGSASGGRFASSPPTPLNEALLPPRSDDNRTRKKRNSHGIAARCKKPVLKAVLHAQRRQPQQLNGSVSESFGSLTSLPAPPRARRGRGAANHAQNNMDASMSYTGNYEAGEFGQKAPPASNHRRAPATRRRQCGTPKHQTP